MNRGRLPQAGSFARGPAMRPPPGALRRGARRAASTPCPLARRRDGPGSPRRGTRLAGAGRGLPGARRGPGKWSPDCAPGGAKGASEDRGRAGRAGRLSCGEPLGGASGGVRPIRPAGAAGPRVRAVRAGGRGGFPDPSEGPATGPPRRGNGPEGGYNTRVMRIMLLYFLYFPKTVQEISTKVEDLRQRSAALAERPLRPSRGRAPAPFTLLNTGLRPQNISNNINILILFSRVKSSPSEAPGLRREAFAGGPRRLSENPGRSVPSDLFRPPTTRSRA